MNYKIEQRRRITVNTDPQRRCYNGCHYSSETLWTGWGTLHSGLSLEKAQRRLRYWRELNDYAVSQRGDADRSEYRLVEGDKDG